MKQYFKIGTMFGVLAVFLSSCLKDTPTTDYSDKAIKPIILVPNGNWPRTTAAAPWLWISPVLLTKFGYTPGYRGTSLSTNPWT